MIVVLILSWIISVPLFVYITIPVFEELYTLPTKSSICYSGMLQGINTLTRDLIHVESDRFLFQYKPYTILISEGKV